jgi:hypothetical protein
MTGVQGRTEDGRPAWLLSVRRREWVVVDEETQARLIKERHRFWQKGLYLLIILLVLNPLVDYLFSLRTTPWLALLLAHLHLLQENHAWTRLLQGAGRLQQGGVVPVARPREAFWQLLSFVPLLLALPVVFLDWSPGGMGPRPFLLLMLLFWVLIALEIHQVRGVRALDDEEDGRGNAPPQT